ncbi:T9SS type A sorting domain-containing protein [Dyadobacter sp. CY261]|uniref:right-handed parallel beta-helix repeat-containing protein n=1 Tax=Dyadobacter sp. CY261 TaxID=2907203 RepID=UPI001F18761D|nr:right-handed parallel beta-helix repeat-containing protein [Dyadobacter sp. CY261]MCF0074896.1 T9SS type A sorting domain-containing protein [Dyadobacter sp. CY261]
MKNTFYVFLVARRISAPFLLLVLVNISSGAFATTRYVKQNAVGTGSSWEDASGDVQAVIDASASGDEVWVAGGTYSVSSSYFSFKMKEGVKIYGGFAGTEAILTSRVLTGTINESILQSNIVNDFYGERGLTNATVLDGFTLASGIRNYESSPMMVNLIITGGWVGGVYNSYSSPILINCTITKNGQIYGGGITNISSSPILINCTITGNSGLSGGGMANISSFPILINCTITGNTGGSAGGIWNKSSSPIITNCTISGNAASDEGGVGGILNGNYNGSGNSYPQLRNSIVFGNGRNIKNETGSSMIIQYSLAEGETNLNPNDHNLLSILDPLFVDPANGDYRLQRCSPAVNTGSNSFYDREQIPDLSAITTDLAGDPRFYENGLADVGAYEYQGNSPAYIKGIWYVKAGAEGPGVSWECASGDLQSVIEKAASGDEVWVAGGRFDVGASISSFRMKEGVKIYGGFTGTETSLANRDLTVATNASILQSSIVNDFHGESGLTNAAVLDGFTLLMGIRNYDSSPKLVNLIISAGSAGGVYNDNSSPTLINCTITKNDHFYGGGVTNIHSLPILINCTITGNTGGYGGGIANLSSSPVLINCTITGNTGGSAGGVWNGSSSPIITNCTISGNTASDEGGVGGIFNGNYYGSGNSNPQFRNSIVFGNGSSIKNERGSSMIIRYSLAEGLTNLNPDDHNLPGDWDPLFVDPIGGDYRLEPCSPLIDMGNDYYTSNQVPDLSYISTDLDHHLRKLGIAVDLGAYEFTGTPTTVSLIVDDGEFTGAISGDFTLKVNGSPCLVIANLQPNGAAPIGGALSAKVWVEDSQPTNFLKRHYQITPETNAENATAKVTLYFTQQEFTDFNAVNLTKLPVDAEDTENYKANILIEKRSGVSNDGSGLPNSYTGTPVTINPFEANGKVEWNAGANRWEVSFDVTGFSGFFVKTTESSLPLHLISFTARKEEGSNLLQWSTASEVNTSNFEIQGSGDAKQFSKIATVEAAGSGDHQYSYDDRTTYSGTVYYRLKMSDRAANRLDGTFTYSEIVSLRNEDRPNAVYPNPAGAAVTFRVSNVLLKSTVNLYDLTGRKLQTIVITGTQQQINTKSLARGLYVLKFADGTAERFVKE